MQTCSPVTPFQDVSFGPPNPKRRRLNGDHPNWTPVFVPEQSNDPRVCCEIGEDRRVSTSSVSPENKKCDKSFVHQDWHVHGSGDNPREGPDDMSFDDEWNSASKDDDDVFLEQAWGNGELKVDYDIDNELGEGLDEIVCFGMLEKLPIATGPDPINVLRDGIVAAQVCHDRVFLESGSSDIGTIDPETAKAIRVLSEDTNTFLQLQCRIKTEFLPSPKRQLPKTIPITHIHLSILIYGPFRNFDAVGNYVEECGFYLQDPEGCNRNVPYRNPHRLSGTQKNPPMTLERELEHANSKRRAYGVASDFLDALNSQDGLQEKVTPGPVKTPLYPHQRKALAFMLRREKGWDFHGARPDVWKDAGRGCYLNTISKDVHVGQPPIFQGGILADHMGMGKSLSIISLIASGLPSTRPSTSLPLSGNCDQCSDSLHCTLLVVPPNLLHTWETQLNRHLFPGSLRYRRHHGKDRIKQRSALVDLDVIVTTYQTITTEYQKRHSTSSILFTVNWHRIILDEAHYIRDRTAITSRAVCALEGQRRWALTGTPVQNSITDLASLFQFIRAYPYSNFRTFDQDIVRNLSTEAGNTGIERLKKLFACLAIRRMNDTIDLPPRTDRVLTVRFSSEERALYEAVRAQAAQLVMEAKNADNMSQQIYRNALRHITALRMICNLGNTAPLPIRGEMQGLDASKEKSWNAVLATETYEDLLAAGQACCQRCKSTIDCVENMGSMDSYGAPVVAQCLRILCGTCSRNMKTSAILKPWCGHRSHCANAPVDPNLRLKTPLLISPEGCPETSSKISSLMKAIKSTPGEKSVVFSTWTSTLDAIEKALCRARIRYVRYDGAVSPTNRIAVLDVFRNDPAVPVMLITTACGAVGLDLTSASHAYLMEPHWNPTVEEQALARIHRMGQTKEVTTVRFIIEESYEQHVINVKSAKTRVVDSLFPHNSAGLTPELIQNLEDII